MRKVRRYHATADTAPMVRAVACDPGGTDLRVSVRYPAKSKVVTIATTRPIRDARFESVLVHEAHMSPGARPAVCSPQRAHGLLEASGHSPGELSGRSTASQVLGADVVLDDRRLERATQPARRLELTDVV